ncbi:MAG: hypothetical protein ACRCTA_05335, partial [Bacilli bacterium]
YELLSITKQASINLDRLAHIDYLVLAGANDLLSANSKDLVKYTKELKKLNLNVTSVFYQGMKHEILNETNKQLVYDDIINFIIKDENNAT